MDFALTKDQELIQQSAREFFKKECPKDKVRELKQGDKGYDPRVWKKMVRLGYTGLILPERYGGAEGDFIELMVLIEEIGRNIVPGPFFTTVVQCAAPILEFGSDKQKAAYLPGIAEKGEIWSFVMDEAAADCRATDIHLEASRQGAEYILNGKKLFIPYANSAKYYLVVARSQRRGEPEKGISVFIVDADASGIATEPIPTAAHDLRCEVRFDNVHIPAENLLGKPNCGWLIVDYILQRSAVLKAAEMSGGCQAVLELTLKYARERKQFNKQIGSFQAIQHRLVDLQTQVEGLKYLVHEAAWNVNHGFQSRMLCSMSKAMANTVYHRICYHGIVMHGAIGWTEEMDIGLYHVRTRSLASDAGGTGFHLDQIATALDDYQPEFQKLSGV
jgi:alkylation response protein AidB-like acyl-CoA dehydrogenase